MWKHSIDYCFKAINDETSQSDLWSVYSFLPNDVSPEMVRSRGSIYMYWSYFNYIFFGMKVMSMTEGYISHSV